MFKEKYASALNEYEKFWERTNTDRCILNMSYRKEGLTRNIFTTLSSTR